MGLHYKRGCDALGSSIVPSTVVLRASSFGGRDHDACRNRWCKLHPEAKANRKSLVRWSEEEDRWSEEEDASLNKLVQEHGAKNWSFITSSFVGREVHSCCDRWYYLHPEANRSKVLWSEEEDKSKERGRWVGRRLI